MDDKAIMDELLLTGNRGTIGRVVEPYLQRCGYVVRTFDVHDSQDVRLLLTALDAWVSAPSREMARRLLPQVPWRGGSEYEVEPGRTLVDISRAVQVLGWTPRYRWTEQVNQ